MIVCLKDIFSAISGIILFVVLQIVYIITLIIIRPFHENINNISKQINEILFLIILASLFYFRNQSKWNSIVEIAFIGIILSNSLIVSGIYLVYSIKNITLAIKKCNKSKDKVQKYEHNENHPNTNQIVSINDNQAWIKRDDRVLYMPREEVKFENISQVTDNQLHIPRIKKQKIYHRDELRN